LDVNYWDLWYINVFYFNSHKKGLRERNIIFISKTQQDSISIT